MPLAAESDFLPGVKHGYGFIETVRLSGGLPGLSPTSATTIENNPYWVVDQYTMPLGAAQDEYGNVAKLLSVTFYSSMVVTYSGSAPSSLAVYLQLVQNATTVKGTSTGGAVLATSPQNYLGASTVYSYLTNPNAATTNATPTWVQVDMRDAYGHAYQTLNPGDTISLVWNWSISSGTITAITTDSRAFVDFETFSARG